MRAVDSAVNNTHMHHRIIVVWKSTSGEKSVSVLVLKIDVHPVEKFCGHLCFPKLRDAVRNANNLVEMCS